MKWTIEDYDEVVNTIEVRQLFVANINLHGRFYRIGIGHLSDKAVTFWVDAADFRIAYCAYAKRGDSFDHDGKCWSIIDGKWRLAGDNYFSL